MPPLPAIPKIKIISLLHITPLNIQNSPQAITSQDVPQYVTWVLHSCNFAFGSYLWQFEIALLVQTTFIYLSNIFFHNISTKIINLSLNKLKLLPSLMQIGPLCVQKSAIVLSRESPQSVLNSVDYLLSLLPQ